MPRRRPDQGQGEGSERDVEQEDRGDELGLGGVEHVILEKEESWLFLTLLFFFGSRENSEEGEEGARATEKSKIIVFQSAERANSLSRSLSSFFLFAAMPPKGAKRKAAVAAAAAAARARPAATVVNDENRDRSLDDDDDDDDVDVESLSAEEALARECPELKAEIDAHLARIDAEGTDGG